MSPGERPSPAAAPAPKRPTLTLVQGTAGSGLRRLASLPTATAMGWIVAVLCVLGLVMVMCASAYTSLQIYGSAWYIAERQILWMGVGTVVLWGCTRVDYTRWRRFKGVMLLASFGLLVAVFVPGIGAAAVSGSSRWIGFGMLRVQPSEFMKLALAVFAADLLTRRAHQMGEARRVVGPLIVIMAAAALLLLKQPDMGTAIVIVCITFGLLFAADAPASAVFKTLGVTVFAGVVFSLAEPYRRARLLSFLHPFSHAQGSGYQVVQSLVGLGSGGMFGLGLGGGTQQWGLLPNAHTDFIFSVIGEDTGLLGAVVVLMLFLGLGWCGLRAAARAPDRFGALLAVACTVWITSQAVINIGTVIGGLPVTGIPLPFISFGGSSLVVTMAAAGILMNIAAHERVPSVARPAARPRRS
ncbi:MAG: putative lipid II flippase FtsW [Acidimicrobiales bacterium]